jgi:hypothetical protein
MLQIDYCKIIIFGLSNSPDHLLPDYYNREIENLKAKFYSQNEIEYHLELVISMLKEAISKSYESQLRTFEDYEAQDMNLPLNKRYLYPKPDINEVQIFHIQFPHSDKLIFPPGRSYYLKDFVAAEKALSHVFNKSKKGTSKEESENKQLLIREVVEPFFGIIKDYFDEKYHEELKRILESGGKVNNKLLFRENGNKLSDAFKQLHEHNMIVGWQKKELIQLIIENFLYRHQGKVIEFKQDTVTKTISAKHYPCKNPIIGIDSNVIFKIDPYSKKRRSR